ncbi:MAG: DctP family TRAP transporter solute-binding subunit [Rhodospirillales bacterium]
MKKLIAAVAAVLGAASIAVALTVWPTGADCDSGEIVIKFSHVTNTDKHPKGIAAALLAQRVNNEMNGKACMKVFPHSRLYDDNKVLDAVLSGEVHLAAPSLSKFEKFTKKFRLFDLPFVFEDISAVDRFQNSDDGQKLKDSMKSQGLQGLAFWHNGMKQLSANRPLMHPSDAAGLKFRIQASDVLQAQFETLDAVGRKMAFKDVYDALKAGVVDGHENTWSNIYGEKFFEVQDGVTETNHGIIDYLVVTSVEWWDGLPEDVRSQFAQILFEVTETRNKEADNVDRRNRQLIINSHGMVRRLTTSHRAAWVEAMRPVWDKFEDDIGKDLIKAAQSYNIIY